MRLLLSLIFVTKIAAIWIARAAPGTAAALWFVPDLLMLYHLFAPGARGILTMHPRFVAQGREVWLTIDDGPDPDDTPRILKLLTAHGAKATFFVIGEHAAAHPDLVRAMIAGGHEVANHTQTHPLGSFWCAPPARLGREIDECLAVLHGIGATPTRFRPPAGLRNLLLGPALARRRLQCIGWSVRGLERLHSDPRAVADRVLRGLAPGAILLMHEGPRVHPALRVEALRLVLEGLREMGYRCVIPARDQVG